MQLLLPPYNCPKRYWLLFVKMPEPLLPPSVVPDDQVMLAKLPSALYEQLNDPLIGGVQFQ